MLLGNTSSKAKNSTDEERKPTPIWSYGCFDAVAITQKNERSNDQNNGKQRLQSTDSNGSDSMATRHSHLNS